eukprot:TRINITY_DN21024_c0_g1_i1.p1 TRINITY_DN21024_c0_g1~~TRINITY_DN21024_c0_g1_i1.p1  ORF type:complete len:455 (+),score=95.91 TRINITY_DN21024_c0_g1_i1:175-1539(+)
MERSDSLLGSFGLLEDEYLRINNIPSMLREACRAAAEERPSDPKAFISDFIGKYEMLPIPKWAPFSQIVQQAERQKKKGRVSFDFPVHDNDESSSSDTSGAPIVTSKVASIENLLDDLRTHLMEGVWSDICTGVDEYLITRRTRESEEQEDNNSSDDDDSDDDDGSLLSSEGEDDDDSINEEHLARGIGQTLIVLKDSIASYDRGAVSIDLHVTNNSHTCFSGLSETMASIKDEITDLGVDIQFQPFPIRKRHDDFKGFVNESQVLMWARICVTKEGGVFSQEQNFEIFVNLLGSSAYREHSQIKSSYTTYEIIPSFGQLVNVKQPSRHEALCNPDAVVKVKSLEESIHHFKLSLVRVAEHIIHTVIHGEFLHDIARRISLASSEEPLFRKMLARRTSTPHEHLRKAFSGVDLTRNRRKSAPNASRTTLHEIEIDELDRSIRSEAATCVHSSVS